MLQVKTQCDNVIINQNVPFSSLVIYFLSSCCAKLNGIVLNSALQLRKSNLCSFYLKCVCKKENTVSFKKIIQCHHEVMTLDSIIPKYKYFYNQKMLFP